MSLLRKYLIWTALYCSFSLLAVCRAEAEVPVPEGRRLRDIIVDRYSDGSFIIGVTTGAWAYGTETGIIMDREYSYVTPENDFKQWNIHPDPQTWNWHESDAWVSHIAENGQILRMHCPIGPQCSEWAKDDTRKPGELEQNFREFFTAVCKRYNGKPGIMYMDVVNETVVHGKWHKDKPGIRWECPWYKMGVDTDDNKTPLYIKAAFEIAAEYAPDIKLIYNHHENPVQTNSWDRIKETIRYLREKGLRVDGIGWQAHINNGWDTPRNISVLRDLIDWAQDNSLEFHITEAGVYIKGQEADEAALERQAQTYRSLVQVLLDKRMRGRTGFNMWQVDDRYGWKPQEHPALFDMYFKPKPAYYAVQGALEKG